MVFPRFVATAALLAGCSPVETRSVDRLTASGELIALSGGRAGAQNACFSCHGLRGEGDGAGTPRLAGLDTGYLLRQLEAYADGRRRHSQMGWIARQMAPRERELVSAFYASLPLHEQGTRPLSIPSLFLFGDPRRGITACATCHGVHGEGKGPAYPPLAGQPSAYLAHQIDAWRHSKRRTDPGDMMLRISQLLTPSENAALAAYAATLPVDPSSQESPATFREARRVDPRSDALGPPLHVPESARAAE